MDARAPRRRCRRCPSGSTAPTCETVESPSAAGGLHEVLEAERPLMAVLGSSLAAPLGRLLARQHRGAAVVGRAVRDRRDPARLLGARAAHDRRGCAAGPEEFAAISAASTLATGSGAALRDRDRRAPDAGGRCRSAASVRCTSATRPTRSCGPRRAPTCWCSARAPTGRCGAVLAGGVARRVLAGARCPVMLVPRAGAPRRCRHERRGSAPRGHDLDRRRRRS